MQISSQEERWERRIYGRGADKLTVGEKHYSKQKIMRSEPLTLADIKQEAEFSQRFDVQAAFHTAPKARRRRGNP